MLEGKKDKKTKDLPEPVTLIETQKIMDQMNNNICRIFINDKIGTGFLLIFHINRNYYLF